MYVEWFTPDAAKVHELIREKSLFAATPALPNTGHLVLALMDGPGYAGQILRHLGLEYSKFRDVEKLIVKFSPQGELTDAQILTHAAELDDTFRMSALYAKSEQGNEIDTEHLLMGLFCCKDTVYGSQVPRIDPDIDRLGAKIIRNFNIDARGIEREVRKLTRPVKQLFSPY